MTYHNELGKSSHFTDPYAARRQDHHRAVLSRVTQAAMSGLGATAIESRSTLYKREKQNARWRPMHYQTAGSGFLRANFPYRIPGQLGQTTPDATLSPPPVQDGTLSTGLKIGWGAVAVLAVGLFWFTASPPKSVTGNARRRRSSGGHLKGKMSESGISRLRNERERRRALMLARLEAKAAQEGPDSIWAEMLKEHRRS